MALIAFGTGVIAKQRKFRQAVIENDATLPTFVRFLMAGLTFLAVLALMSVVLGVARDALRR
jgi:hypothetical protein